LGIPASEFWFAKAHFQKRIAFILFIIQRDFEMNGAQRSARPTKVLTVPGVFVVAVRKDRASIVYRKS